MTPAARVLGADDANRPAFGIGVKCSHDAHASSDINAAANDCLLGLARALRPQNLERKAMLLENARALPDLRYGSVPQATLANREPQRVLRPRGGGGDGDKEGREPARDLFVHGAISSQDKS